jgi:hypothetical protein
MVPAKNEGADEDAEQKPDRKENKTSRHGLLGAATVPHRPKDEREDKADKAVAKIEEDALE